MCYDEFGPKWTEIGCALLCTTSEHAPQVESIDIVCKTANEKA